MLELFCRVVDDCESCPLKTGGLCQTGRLGWYVYIVFRATTCRHKTYVYFQSTSIESTRTDKIVTEHHHL